MKKIFILGVAVLFSITSLFAQLQSPKEFLGYGLGEKFTRYENVIGYFNHLSEAAPHIKLDFYGDSYEERPMFFAILSSPENMAQIETIREDNLRRAGLLDGTTTTNVPIIWMSYNVHGNEAVGTESAMGIAYDLLATKSEWLQKAVVIIDPCLNPDGRERYVNFYYQHGNLPYNPDPQSIEHLEPWPGGRPNHYLFDLNRDWAWQIQKESQLRMEKYNQWLPHVHADYHEQGVNEPYYFAPAAEPFHELISNWQRKFQEEIGNKSAQYLDEVNRFYFTKQRFDLLYPSYGDTYPTYSGAIGMTYEQGGSGRGGLGVLNEEGDTLTLVERIENHIYTSMAAVEVTAELGNQLLTEFEKFFALGNTTKSGYKAFVVKSGGEAEKIKQLGNWLQKQDIRYTIAGAGVRGLSGYRYSNGKSESFSIDAGDLVVNVAQPKAILTQVLFEPKTKLADTLTYDITAWSIPYAYGLEGYATNSAINVSAQNQPAKAETATPENVYAFIAPWKYVTDAAFLANLLKADVKVRFTTEPLTAGGKQYDRGAIIITKRDNRSDDFEEKIMAIAAKNDRQLQAISSGLVDRGPDIGSSDIVFLKKPKIAILGGEGISSTDFGSLWHFMDQELDYPTTVLHTSTFSRVDLSGYDVLAIPSFWYNTLGEGGIQKIKDWVKGGGKLILFQNAISSFDDGSFLSLKKFAEEEEKEFKEREKEGKKELALLPYAALERNYLKNRVPGAVFKVHLDNTHPLAYGYANQYFSLKTSNQRYAYMESGGNVGTIRSKNDLLSGFAGHNVRASVAGSMVFGTESVGRGDVVYFVDNPLFRSFWHGGKLLVCNALFYVGQ